MGRFARKIFDLSGWRFEGVLPPGEKFVVVSAPHTSNWDFFVGRLFYMAYDIKPKVLIKEESFIFPFGMILKSLGGIPVNRKGHNAVVNAAVRALHEPGPVFLTITPEGTRKLNPHWKLGFYYIALKAKVPLLISYFDYKYKTVGVGDVFMPTGNIEEDIRRIKMFYKDIHPRHPERFTVGTL